MTFFDIAKPMAERGVPQIRVRPNSKAAFDKDWPAIATTDLERLAALSAELPNSNSASVAQAKPGGFWYFEVDSPDVVKRIEVETGMAVPDTFRVRSRPGRGHFYWKQTPASIAMGNISQSYVKGGDWSARVDNQYVVSAGSIHPHSKQPYIMLRDEPINEAPDWLIAWLQAQRVEKTGELATDAIPKDPHGLIPHGYIHGWLVSQAGRLRNIGLDIDTLETALVKLAEERCAPPLDLSKVRQVARSFNRYEPGQSGELLMTQTPVSAAAPEPEPLPLFDADPYPRFPHYVMEGTSLYEKFIKPICEQNERIDYFMWLPAMIMLLNYIGPKVNIQSFGQKFRGSIYTVIIGKKGKSHKTASVQDAMEYFNYAGMLQHAGRDVKNAEGKTLVWTAGSPEGLGLNMQKSNCKNALLFYDELSKLVGKAGIESSSLASDLLTMYEAGKFDNSIKSTKESFSLNPDTYCTSLIACTTNKKFSSLWSKLAGADTGLDDRFFFILHPEEYPKPMLKHGTIWQPSAIETKKLIDKAVNQKEFTFDDVSPLNKLNEIDPRYANRAEKWALAIAVDLGLDSIDGECVERGVDIVLYEIAVKNYLKSYEATTREGQLQQEMRRCLEMARGRMPKRDFERKLSYDKHGTSLWGQCYNGLLKTQVIREEGTGQRGDPMMVQLLIKRESDEDE